MRTIGATITSILAALASSKFAVLVSFQTLGVRYCNHSTAITFESAVYSPAVIVAKGVGENFKAEARIAELTLASLDRTQQERFFNDQFRGDTVTLRIVVRSAGTWEDTTFTYNLTVERDASGPNILTLRLASADAVNGSEIPTRTTQEAGCKWDFKGPRCPFRRASFMSATLDECDKTMDGPIGCRAHFPDFIVSGQRYIQPKPFGGFIGGVSHRLALGR